MFKVSLAARSTHNRL